MFIPYNGFLFDPDSMTVPANGKDQFETSPKLIQSRLTNIIMSQKSNLSRQLDWMNCNQRKTWKIIWEFF